MKRETKILEDVARVESERPRLAVRVLGRLTPEVPIPDDRALTIGSAHGNGIVLEDEFVSSEHALLELSGEPPRLFLHDRRSKNGSYVNGARVLATEVERGSHLKLGRTTLVIVDRDAPGGMDLSSVQSRWSGIVGNSPQMRAVIERAQRAAATPANVVISGESGSGKELVARLVHDKSPRARRDFVVVNCGAIAKDLVESEFFGHERGAFTGATERRTGVFELASGGTLFLDEVGELPLEQQPRLLRVLEARSVRPVGGARELNVDVRVICATNRDLYRDVELGRFRLDLYHRLATIEIAVPPLREHLNDVPLLARHFLADIAREVGQRRFGTGAVEMLTTYPWPGNVRELRNAIARAAILSDGTIHAADLVLDARSGRVADGEQPVPQVFRDFCRDLYVRTITEAGSVREAARRLGIARSTFNERVKALGIPIPDKRRLR